LRIVWIVAEVREWHLPSSAIQPHWEIGTSSRVMSESSVYIGLIATIGLAGVLENKIMANPSQQLEPRWPALLALLVVGGLRLALPESLSAGPDWLRRSPGERISGGSSNGCANCAKGPATITRSLVELHGGRLNLESELDAGSCFFFALPAATTPVKRENRKAEFGGNSRATTRVLVIEDNPASAGLLESHQHPDAALTLMIAGHRVGHYSAEGKLLTPLAKKTNQGRGKDVKRKSHRTDFSS
jgi:hypothetical protein